MNNEEFLTNQVLTVTDLPAGRDFFGQSAELGQAAVVSTVKRKEQEQAQRQQEARMAQAVAEALRPSVEVGKIEAEEPVDKGTPLTAPEPRSTIQAGIKAVGAGGRKGVFSELPFEAEDVPKGWEVVNTEDGGYLAAPKENVDEVVENERTGKRHETLGYVAPKKAEDNQVVQVKDKKGTVVQDVSTNDTDVVDVVAQALDVAGQIKGSIDMVAPEEALQQREEAVAKETGIDPALRKVMTYENEKGYKNSGWDKEQGVWKPHGSIEGGTDTLAYGHKLTPKEVESGLVKIGDKSVEFKMGLTDRQAEELFKQDWDKHYKLAGKVFPYANKELMQPLTEMLYQGIDISKWKAGAALKKASESGDPADYKWAQRLMLNSKWATLQTPDRALDVIHRIYPQTPIEVLKALQNQYTKQRVEAGQEAWNK